MAKTFALVFGIVFLLVGVLGYIENPIVGEDALFHSTGVHNIVHLVSGLVLVGVALGAAASSALVLKVLGVVYLLVAILGFLGVGGDMILGIIDNTAADNWLHLVLGVVLLGAGLKGGKGDMAPSQPMM